MTVRRDHAPWDPRREADARPATVVVTTPVADLLGGAFHIRRQGHDVIGLHPRLSGGTRTAALAHELVHAGRHGVCDDPASPVTWNAVVDREERRVDRIAASRLVPRTTLERTAAGLGCAFEGVTLDDLSSELDLPAHLVALAGDEIGPEPDRRPVSCRTDRRGDRRRRGR